MSGPLLEVGWDGQLDSAPADTSPCDIYTFTLFVCERARARVCAAITDESGQPLSVELCTLPGYGGILWLK